MKQFPTKSQMPIFGRLPKKLLDLEDNQEDETTQSTRTTNRLKLDDSWARNDSKKADVFTNHLTEIVQLFCRKITEEGHIQQLPLANFFDLTIFSKN